MTLSADDPIWGQLERSSAIRSSFTARADADLAARLVALQQAYPETLGAGTKLAFAQANVVPGSATAQGAAEATVQSKSKRKKGLGWHSIGDFVNAGKDLISDPIGGVGDILADVGDVALDVLKPTVRTGLMGLQALWEEPMGVARNVAVSLPGKLGEATAGAGVGAAIGSLVPGVGTAIGAGVGGAIGGVAGLLSPDVKGEAQWGKSQSQLGIALEKAIGGEKVEAGSGWMPSMSSPLAQEQAARARAAASVRGVNGADSAWTFGRMVADVVTEPGTMSYNLLSGTLDAAGAIKLDPSALALRKVGMVRAARKTILPEKVTEFMDSSAGRKVFQAIADEDSAFRIHHMLGKQMGHDPAILAALAKEKDPTKIRELLSPHLGQSVYQKPTATVSRRLTRTRLSLDVPSGHFEWDKPEEFIDKIDSFLGLAKVDEATRLKLNDRAIRALSGPRTGRLPAMKVVADAVAESLVVHGVPRAEARRMTTLFRKSFEDTRWYTGMEVAKNQAVPGLIVGGKKKVGLQSPHYLSEYLNHGVPVPDMKDITRAVSTLKPIFALPGVTPSVDLLNHAMGLVWRPMVLLRAALPVRVGGEEQARMAASGLDSVFSHPMSVISRLIASADTRPGIVRTRRGVPRVGRVALEDGARAPVLSATGEVLGESDAAAAALTRVRGTELFDRTNIKAKHYQRYSPADTEFIDAWHGHELAHARSDVISQQLARGVGADEIKDSFWNGPLSKFRRELRQASDSGAYLDSRFDADAFIDLTISRLKQYTRDDPRLMEYVAKGQRARKADHARAKAVLEELAEAGNTPKRAVGPLTLREGGKVAGYYDAATNTAFDWLMAKPTNYLARSRSFEQFYWKRVSDLLPSLDPADQAKVLANARASKLSRRQIDMLERRAKVTSPSAARVSADQLDFVAKSYGVTETKKLLYDLAKRSQWSEATRLIFPFAEAWKEMVTTWAKILPQNPQAVRRIQQTVNGARGAGFFQMDPQTGEEVFVYPGSQFLSQMVVGAPIPFKGTVSGLNLFANSPLMPGFGPLMQVSASALLPDKPEFDWLQEAISPFGRQDTSGGFLESFLPAWAQKVRKAIADPESDRVFGNTVYDMARYLQSTGRFDISTVEGQEDLTAAATSMGRRMYLLRTLGSFSLPSAPMPQMVAEDKEGRVHTQFKLIEEFRQLQQPPDKGGVGWEDAPQVFMERYGEGALLLMQPKTKGASSPTEDALDWIRSNPGVAKRYKNTYGYFAPQTGEFSITAYLRQIATGEREALTPTEAIRLANHRVASMRFNQMRDRLGANPSKEGRAYLAQLKDALAREYPGYEPMPTDPGRLDRQIRELRDASDDEDLADNPLTGALRTYFAARDKATQAAQAAGFSSHAKAKAMRPVREWLRQLADSLKADTPQFAEVWDRLLARELSDDAEELEVVA